MYHMEGTVLIFKSKIAVLPAHKEGSHFVMTISCNLKDQARYLGVEHANGLPTYESLALYDTTNLGLWCKQGLVWRDDLSLFFKKDLVNANP